MKLATLKNGKRDGRLVVVSRDLTRFTDASFLVPTLQDALDDWQRLAPHLEALGHSLEADAVPSGRFHENDARSPLPRTYQRVSGIAYASHVERMRKMRGAEAPEDFGVEPSIRQGGSDAFADPRGAILVADEEYGIDTEGEVAVAVSDVPMGAGPDEAREAIRLVMLASSACLRALVPDGPSKGSGCFQARPSAALSPVAVTPNELGVAWDGGKVSLPLLVEVNGRPFGKANAGADISFDFPALIVHAARTRPLAAGTIVTSGTVSNRQGGGPGRPVSAGGAGYSCIAEQRAGEMTSGGVAKTPFLSFGDKVRVEMKDAAGRSIFGAIDQTVQKYER